MVGVNKKNAYIKPVSIPLGLIAILLIFFTNVFADAEEAGKQPQQDVNTSSQARRKPVNQIRMVSFNLSDGQRVEGKLESENPYIIEISELKKDKVVISKYNRKDIDRNSIIYKNISELDYWRNMGDYFLQQVWDFENDPDEFMQAIRCYENARGVVVDAVGEGHKLVAELDEKISSIKNDMDKWTDQAKSHAELRKLELLAELDTKLQKIQEQIEANAKDIAEIRQQLATTGEAAKDYKEISKKVTGLEVTTKVLEQRVVNIEDDFDDLWRRYRYQPRYYITPTPKGSNSN